MRRNKVAEDSINKFRVEIERDTRRGPEYFYLSLHNTHQKLYFGKDVCEVIWQWQAAKFIPENGEIIILKNE